MLKCLWHEKWLLLRLWKAFQNTEEWRFLSLFALEIFMFLCCANEESDDVMRFATEMVKYWIKNIFGNIDAVFFKLVTKNGHYKRNWMTLILSLPWESSWLQSLPVENQLKYLHFEPFKVEMRVLLETDMVCILIIWTLIIRLVGVEGPWF